MCYLQYALLVLAMIHGSQALSQNDGREIIALQLIADAVRTDRLPREVINPRDSIFGASRDAVVIQRTAELTSDEVTLTSGNIDFLIWPDEKIFIEDPYWIRISRFVTRNKKATLDFATYWMGATSQKCYKGKIHGNLRSGPWSISRISYHEISCPTLFSLLKEK